MPQTLTTLERRILRYLVEYLRRNTYQPSIREIGKRFGIKSTKTVSEHLQSIADKGHIERDASRSRGVKLLGLDLASDAHSLPVYGVAGAGEQGSFVDEVSTRLAVDRQMLDCEDAFVMEVSGNSMEGAGIASGDLVFIEPIHGDGPADGDVVAVNFNGEPLIKRWYRRGDTVVLESANVEHPPLVPASRDQLEVLGLVMGLFRRLDARPAPAGA